MEEGYRQRQSMLPMDDDPSRSLCGTLISAAASLSPADPSSAPSSFGNLYRYRQSTGAQTSSLLMPNSAPRPSTAPQHSFGAPSALLSAAAVLADLPHPSPLPAPSPFSSFNNVQARAPAAYGQLMGSSTSLGMGGGTTATLTSPGVFSNLSLGVNESNTPTPSLSSLMTSTSGVSSSFTGDFKLGARQPEQNQGGYLSLALGDSMGRAGEDLRRKRVKEDLSQLSSEDKLERTRLQNKTHSRRSRLRKKMYEEQLKSEIQVLGMYRDIVEEARDLISVHSMNMEAVFLYGNMAFDRVLGVSPQSVLGKPLSTILHEEDAAKLAKVLKEALLGNAYQVCTFRVQHSSKRHMEAHCSVTALPGRLLCIMKVTQPDGGDEPSA